VAVFDPCTSRNVLKCPEGFTDFRFTKRVVSTAEKSTESSLDIENSSGTLRDVLKENALSCDSLVLKKVGPQSAENTLRAVRQKPNCWPGFPLREL
jgi:hypothetical protein